MKPSLFVLLVFILLFFALSGFTVTADAQKRPNVLFVMADQWRASAFGFAGNPDVQTPALDAFCNESIYLTNAVSSSPVCCPARASLMTGRRALSHGVFMNDISLNPKVDSLAKTFAKAGYTTGYIGKWHLDGHGRSAYIPPARRHGFTYWRAQECTHDYNHSPYYGDGQQKFHWPTYDADAQTLDAENFIRKQQSASRPFFLMLSWGPPHEPYQTAPEKYKLRYDRSRIRLRPNVPLRCASRARRDLSGYYAHCTALDHCMGHLLNTLNTLHLADNTLVIFTSDHGDMLWSHGAEKKEQPWDESCRIPLLMRLPKSLGQTARALPATIVTEDIMPTILGLCHLRSPKSVQGLDFSRYLCGGNNPSDGAALVLCPAPFGHWCRRLGGREYRALRTQRYTYVRDLKGPWMLFDNQTDPYQQHNLVNSPGCANIQKQLDAWLSRKLKQTGDNFETADVLIRRWGYRVDAAGTVPYEP